MPTIEEKLAVLMKTIDNTPQQIRDALTLAEDVKAIEKPDHIIIAGMGGSGLPAEYLQSYLGDTLVFTAHHDYDLPKYATSHSLVVVISYSGDTEEAISSFNAAMAVKAKIFVITSGGKLRDLCHNKDQECILVPSDIQPRYALPYQFIPLLKILSNSGLIPDQTDLLKKAADQLESSDYHDVARNIAANLQNRTPIIYSSRRFKCVAYKWKINFNETGKTMAFANDLPELDHNELVAFTQPKGNYYVIMLSDDDDHSRVRRRMILTRDLIAKNGVETTLLDIKGDSFLTKLFTATTIGDLVSYYYAEAAGVDPWSVDVIEDLKKELRS